MLVEICRTIISFCTINCDRSLAKTITRTSSKYRKYDSHFIFKSLCWISYYAKIISFGEKRTIPTFIYFTFFCFSLVLRNNESETLFFLFHCVYKLWFKKHSMDFYTLLLGLGCCKGFAI